MTIYVLNYILLFIYMICYLKSKNKKIKSFLLFLSILQLVLIQGLRNVNLGSDMPYYWKYYELQMFNNINDLSFSRYEILFKVLTKIVTKITLNKQIYLLVLSLLSTLPIGLVVYKKSKNPIMSLLLFLAFGFYNFNFSGLRQAIAFGIIFYSYTYITEKKPIKFIITVLIASLFHSSAIVFLPAYFLVYFKITKLKIIIIALIDILIYIFKVQIFVFFNNLFYENYNMVITNSVNWMIMCLTIVFFCLLFYKKIASKDSSLLYNLVVIGSSIMLLSPIANNILRISNYYFMFIILLIPEVVYSFKKVKYKFSAELIVVLLSFALYFYLLYVDSYNIVPYTLGV